ncbi:MAG: fatty acid metabolism transcriptional regulator FadR [Chloroflexota bacterium]
MHWDIPPKPAEITENRLIDAILGGAFPIGSSLPAERELAAQLGVTRPTLREALQRLGRDGWIEVRHGRPTRVRDYWREGNLGVLGAIARRAENLPEDFVPNLLYVRLVMAPAYTRLAVESAPQQVQTALQAQGQLPDEPAALAEFDWQLHYQLTLASGNPIFTLILNGFSDLYLPMARLYFQTAQARASSRRFYADLLAAALAQDAQAAEEITRQVMADSLELWQQAKQDENARR